MAKTQKKGGRKREKKNVTTGRINIRASFNNTVVTVTDPDGNALSWCSSGMRGFKGAKKGTAYAAGVATEAAVRKAMDSGLREADIYSTGPGSGKEAAIRMVNNLGIRVRKIKDFTPVAHNGCRPKGRRRV